MSVTCANCRAEIGDASSCPQCGTAVLSPQSAVRSPDPSSWRTDTAERPAAREPVEPPPATTPIPARYPLFADELDVAAHSGPAPETPPVYASMPSAPAPPPAHRDRADRDDDSGGVPSWVAWAVLALVLVLVAAGGVWLLFSPGDGDSLPEDPRETLSVPRATTSDREPPPSTEPADPGPAPSGDPVEVASTATATAPRTAPPNADVFGNRTTYAAANMLDGLPDTCWRMPGNGTGLELTFQLASPTSITRVGMVNGYAKDAVVGGRTLDWYAGNRRVLMARWTFDDGTTVDQPLGDTRQLQTIDLGAAVTTSTVKLRLVAVSSPGTGRSARDYTAVSEVTLVGLASA